MHEASKFRNLDDKSYQIYALIDPRDNIVQYVGMSADVQIRFHGYLHGNWSGMRQRRWIASLEQKELHPILQVLETIEPQNNSYALACERELFWIQEMTRLGYPLLNVLGLARSYFPSTINTKRQPKFNHWNGETKVIATVSEELTVDQVADELKVHPKRVYKWIQNGELTATDLGTRARHNYRINRSDLNDFKRRRRTTPREDDSDENNESFIDYYPSYLFYWLSFRFFLPESSHVAQNPHRKIRSLTR